jgi:NAD(P)-dependent dehydrogenase (short-subunit alcohol dehydrogenase family)
MDMQLRGKSVLITGASQGIGEGLAMAFAREGANLRLVARSQAKLEALARRVRAEGCASVCVLAVDITSPSAVDQIMTFAGTSDILINNAGSIPGGNLLDVDEKLWRAGWELKVFGYINLIRAIYPVMKARRDGVILNNIGSGGENYDANYIAGCTGNAALMALTRALGGTSLEDGIRVVGVNPGPVATDRMTSILQSRAEQLLGDGARFSEFLSNYPRGRPAHVQEVADLFVFLASPRSNYTTGTIVTVDGGLTSKRSIT